jgi:limonene-1,2-epoxide hydrolase
MAPETAFERAVQARDADAITAALAPDVRFRSPVVFSPYEGPEAVSVVLRAVTQVFEEFEYVQRLEATDGSIALIFRAKVGDRELDGLDLLRFDNDGQVTELTVMVRPMSGINALAEAMAEELRRMGVPVPGGA